MVGNSANNPGFLHITGTGSSLTTAGTPYISIGGGTNSPAIMVVDAGATVSGNFALAVNGNTNADATFSIRDTGSSLTSANNVTVGISGASNRMSLLEVKSGATFYTTANTYLFNDAVIHVGAGSTYTSWNYLTLGDNTAANASATLMGTGTVSSSNFGLYLFGRIRPGDTPEAAGTGTLTLDGPTRMSSLTTSLFEFTAPSNYDRINITGPLLSEDFASLGSLVLDFEFAPSLSETFTIFSVSGSISGDFTDVIWSGLATGGTLSWVGGDLVISNVSAIPEPSVSFSLAAAGVGATVVWLRRKRKNFLLPAFAAR